VVTQEFSLAWSRSGDRLRPWADVGTVAVPARPAIASSIELNVWRKQYNEERHQGAIGHRRPIMFLNHDGATGPTS